ncbi:hypothetical protein BCV69DRAFT_299658 [Microstroma glucosiphilum]|uniref:Uncharacterized protein n=1 Tax=Pseudomicrostroma glucosiphilum TaxID=1684307 RepID=A0A316U3T6_9BASI|nr:hypothetical protein BCV69DRAFT_299658 [Pseudomicrostroma glucosiphilum]PWN19897.1 hypothetical protein BCV69DRAFT_299658 [Pseudomicrostroma glucosiphilum]
MSSSFDANAPATLLELVTTLQVVLDASAVTATKRSQIAIVVLTGLMGIASPLLFYRLWWTGKLWFFRLQRRSQGTYLVAHPLTVFSALLSMTGVLVLGCIIVKYKYAGASITPEALPVYTSVVLTSWILLPIGPLYTILGTICAIPESDAGTAWHHKVRRVLGGPMSMNMLNTLAPLVWIVITTAFAAQTTVHFHNAYDASRSLQRQLAQGLAATATAAQMATAHRAWGDFMKGFDCIRIVASIWAATVCGLVISVLVVGTRICCILRRQLRQLGTASQSKHTQQKAEKARSIRESIIILGSFYVLLASSGIILLVAMAITAARLAGQDVSEALNSYRLLQLVFMWTVAVNGTGVIGLFSGRVFTAVSVGAIDKGPVTASMLRRRRAGPGTETADATAQEEKRGWANTALKRTSGILNTPKVGRGKASPPCVSMTTSGIQVDVEEEMVLDEADLDAISAYKRSGSSSANSTPLSRLTKLPSQSPSITSPPLAAPLEEAQEALPPWEQTAT